MDVVEAVAGSGGGTSLPDRVEASRWVIRLPQLPVTTVQAAVEAFLAAQTLIVERLMKDGIRQLDARAAVVSMSVSSGVDTPSCAILHLVVQHVTPAVRPDDVLSGLRSVADLVPPVPPEATRYAQGPLTETGEIGDPLAPDRLVNTTAGATLAIDDLEQIAAGARPPG